MPRVSVVLGDDHHLVRAAIRGLLTGHPDIDVVGEGDSGSAVLDLVDRLKPDLVLLDLAMPGMSGLEAMRQLAERRHPVRIIALSSHTEQKWVRQALHAGVRGYVLKTETAENLALAVRTVHRGQRWFSEPITAVIAQLSLDPELADVDPLARLSPRQRLVLQLIAEGHTNKSIASTLEISESTVDSHRTQLMRRLDAHDVAGLVRFAIQEGVISVD